MLSNIDKHGDPSMPPRPDILATTRAVLRLLLGLNALFGAGIAALLATSLAAPLWLQTALGAPASLMTGMRLIMLIGLAGIPLAYLILARLLAMVQTVRAGDPFIPENAHRLQRIAQALLGIQLLNLAVGAVCAAASTPTNPLDIGWSPSVDGWLAVLLLFVLARVFDLGTQMRADLEATV